MLTQVGAEPEGRLVARLLQVLHPIGPTAGPVWVVDRVTKKRYLVAIHIGARSGRACWGVLLTPDVIDQLGRWGIGKRILSIPNVASVQ